MRHEPPGEGSPDMPQAEAHTGHRAWSGDVFTLWGVQAVGIWGQPQTGSSECIRPGRHLHMTQSQASSRMVRAP